MKKILISILILIMMFKVKGQTPQAPIIFSTVSQMQAYTGSYYQAWVNDTIQGGLFKGILGGTNYVDSGITFQGTGRQWQRVTTQSDPLLARWWGVRGDSSDQTLALNRCFNYSIRSIGSAATIIKGNLGRVNIVLPFGIILYKGNGLHIDSTQTGISRGIRLVGQGTVATRIKMTDSTKYLIDCNGAVNYMDIEDFQMDGGAGLFIQRAKFLAGSGAPTFKKTFKGLYLANYAVCAICSNLNNDPFYDVNNCKFDGGIRSMAIFLAPGGGHLVHDNWMRQGRTFVAMRAENNTSVFNNRIAGSNPQNANGGRQILWLIADADSTINQNYGQGIEVFNNFLGNEASNPYDVCVFFSYADTSSNPSHSTAPNWGSYFPLFQPITNKSVSLKGLSIHDNTWNVDAGHKRGIMYSELERISFSYYNNFHANDFPYLFQMDSLVTSFSATNNLIQSNWIDVSRPDLKTGFQQNMLACNLPGFGLIYDPQHVLKASAPQIEFPAPSGYQYQALTLDTFRVLFPATIGARQLGVDGQLDMQEITFLDSTGAISARITNENTANQWKMTWLEIDAKIPSTNAAKEFKIEIDSSGGHGSIHQWMVKVPNAAVGTITVPLPFLLPIITGSWIVQVSIAVQDFSPTTNRILIGRLRMYQSDSRKAVILPTFIGTSASTNLITQAAVGNITTLTSASTSSTYDISGYVNVRTITTDSIQAQITYTDINSNSVTAIVPLLKQSTGIAATNTGSTGNYSFNLRSIRVLPSTTITVKTVLTTSGGSITFDAGAYINFITTNTETSSP